MLQETRDSIADVYGPPVAGSYQTWPLRIDERLREEPDKWVQSFCMLCSTGCGLAIGVKDWTRMGVARFRFFRSRGA